MSPIELPPFPTDVPVADISTVDYAKLTAGDKSQSQAIYEAAKGHGFFYLSNHEIDSLPMFELADQVFSLPLEEKMKYDMGSTGHYFGYKRAGAFLNTAGQPDSSQFFNISKNDMLSLSAPRSTSHPAPINTSHACISTFMRSSHAVVSSILDALSTHLSLPAGILASMHTLTKPSACQTRLTHAPPLQAGKNAIGEHTDFGSVTILFNQLGGLQVLDPGAKEWVYVKPRPGCAIINLGDALVKLLGGRVYSGLHRVVGPPGKQEECERHSVVYFCRPNSDVKLRSLFPEDGEDEKDALYSDEWVKMRAKSLNKANATDAGSLKFRVGTAHNAKGTGAGGVPVVAAS